MSASAEQTMVYSPPMRRHPSSKVVIMDPRSVNERLNTTPECLVPLQGRSDHYREAVEFMTDMGLVECRPFEDVADVRARPTKVIRGVGSSQGDTAYMRWRAGQALLHETINTDAGQRILFHFMLLALPSLSKTLMAAESMTQWHQNGPREVLTRFCQNLLSPICQIERNLYFSPVSHGDMVRRLGRVRRILLQGDKSTIPSPMVVRLLGITVGELDCMWHNVCGSVSAPPPVVEQPESKETWISLSRAVEIFERASSPAVSGYCLVEGNEGAIEGDECLFECVLDLVTVFIVRFFFGGPYSCAVALYNEKRVRSISASRTNTRLLYTSAMGYGSNNILRHMREQWRNSDMPILLESLDLGRGATTVPSASALAAFNECMDRRRVRQEKALRDFSRIVADAKKSQDNDGGNKDFLSCDSSSSSTPPEVIDMTTEDGGEESKKKRPRNH